MPIISVRNCPINFSGANLIRCFNYMRRICIADGPGGRGKHFSGAFYCLNALSSHRPSPFITAWSVGRPVCRFGRPRTRQLRESRRRNEKCAHSFIHFIPGNAETGEVCFHVHLPRIRMRPTLPSPRSRFQIVANISFSSATQTLQTPNC